jgi:serine/threonine protein kinase/WD40 repeat protein
MPEPPPSSQREQKLDRVLADYLHAVEAGTPPDRAELLRQHPDLAADLDSFFRNRDAMQRIAAPLKQQVPEPETIGPSPAAGAGVGTALRYFGDYELLEEIARGGMGVVYKARQVSLNRIVAVKMILAGQLASEPDVARFRAEAEAAAHLDHPHIVPIYEVGEHQGQHYFSMKLVEGGNLTSLRRDEPASGSVLRTAVSMVASIALAVHHAHQRSIVHRDLKPGNILIDAAGQPHVTDFGLAKRVEGGSDLTRSGAIVGTPSYMAPEQARSEKVLTTAVDVYSLGAILYELLTGQPPFRAATPLETLLQVVEREPERPRALNPRLPRDLETVCLKCLEKDPRRRYGSAEALADDLHRWLAGEPVKARHTPPWERLTKWVRRRPATAALLGVSAGATVLLIASLLFSNARILEEKEQTQQALLREREALAARTKAETAALEALRIERTVSYANRVALAYAEWHDNHLSLATTALDRCPAELRGWEWHYVNRLCRSTLLTVPSWGLTVAYSPDGRYLVSGAPAVDNKCGAWILDAATGKEVRLLSGLANHVCHAAFSDDARYLAAASHWQLGSGDAKVWDTATGKELFTLFSPYSFHGMALSPDGQRIYLSERAPGKAEVNGYTVADGKKFLSIPDKDGRALNPIALSRDGKRLAIANDIRDALTGKKLMTCQADDGGGIAQLAFSPDGRRLAAASDPVVVWDTSTGKPLWASHGQHAACVAFGPDGTRLAVGIQSVVRMVAADTGKELSMLRTGYSRSVTGIAFHPDGTRLAASGLINEPVKIWDIDTREVYTIAHPSHDLAQNGYDPDNLVFSPDGRTCASIASNATAVRLFDLATTREMGVYRLPKDQPDGRYLRLAYRPDGNLLALCGVKAGDHKTYTLQVRELMTGRTLFTARELALAQIGESALQRWVAFSADGSRLAVGVVDGNEDALVWDVARGQLLCTLPPGTYKNGGVLQFSPDGRKLAVARFIVALPAPASGAGAIGSRLFDTDTGKLILEQSSNGLMFSPNSRLIAIQDKDDRVVLFDTATGKELHTLAGAGLIQAFSPDSSRLATSRKVWDTTGGKAVCSWDLNVWSSGVFSPDGRRFAVRGNGFARNQVEVWDPETGQQTFTLRGLAHPISRLHFSLDGHRLIAVDDFAVTIWDATPGTRAARNESWGRR